MKAFPLLRIRWSNEHIMTAVFGVTVLYLIPSWLRSPLELFNFAMILAVALLVETAIHIIRYKRPVCAVSAAVTTAILQVLTPGIPLWGRFLGIGIALAGKHLGGGTGKNIFNPAITAFLILCLLFKIDFAIVTFSFLLIPALLLSSPFLLFRPFAAMGMIMGMIPALLLHHHFTGAALIGIIFWGCLVVTDPVTTTVDPYLGLFGGFSVGFLPLYWTQSGVAMALALLAFNGLSFVWDQHRLIQHRFYFLRPLKLRKAIPFIPANTGFLDLTEQTGEEPVQCISFTAAEILDRIAACEVFGCGGAAFPAITKIKTVMAVVVPDKYLIVNGVECDPGLIHDQWLLHKFPGEITQGIKLLQQCISLKQVYIAVKDRCITTMSNDTKMYHVPDVYPVGAEKILIHRILRKKIPAGEIPAQAGILVLNVQTVLAIYEAVYHNRPASAKYLTISNLKTQKSRVARLKLGAKISEIINAEYPDSGTGGACVFSGGGFMQARIAEDTDVVERTTNFIAVADYPYYKESPLCSKCGLCLMHCPAGLQVNQIAELADDDKLDETIKYRPYQCISCGSCSYVCLAGRDLAAKVKNAKNFVISLPGGPADQSGY